MVDRVGRPSRRRNALYGERNPDDYVRVFEYDSTFSVESPADVQARLDSFIAQVKQQTGRNQVDLFGHSLGTAVSQTYLNSSPGTPPTSPTT